MTQKPPRSNFVFVYGTLKKNFRANYKLANAIYVGEFETPPIFSMVSVGFPIVYFEKEGGHSVLGELYICSDDELRDLDSYEGYPHHYQRMKIPVAGQVTGVSYEPWIYCQQKRANHFGSSVVPNDKGYLIWDEKPSRIVI